jgi:nitronate monooxygenase
MVAIVILDRLAVPIVLAPLAGGPSTPQLAAAVSNAGGLGFLGAGYLAATALQEQIAQVRTLTSGPFGVNVFVPGTPAGPDAVAAYAARLAAEAQQAGADLGPARFDDDDWDNKLALLAADPVPVVSFTFGCPQPGVIGALQAAGSEVWITVASPADALQAEAAGADALVLQGAEAGGHRSSFTDDPPEPPGADEGFGLLALVQLVHAESALPLVAAGGISTGGAVAAVLAAGASAAQLGTAFLRAAEAGTPQVHRDAVAGSGETAMTRAFTGRLARGIRNRFLDEHSAVAPSAYPEVHHLTSPMRRAARAAGDPDLVNLWAGETHELSRELPAAELVAVLAEEARAAARVTADRLARN